MTPAFLNSVTFLIVASVAAVIAYFIGVLLFRAACDLCAVEPPGWLKSCFVVLVIGVICAPIAYGIGYGFSVAGETFHFSAIPVRVFAMFACIPPCALLAGALYIPLLRVGYLKGTAIYIIQSLLGTLVVAVLGLFLLGGATLVQGIIRLS